MKTSKNEKITILLDRFDQYMESEQEYTSTECEKVISGINTADELKEGLPELLSKAKAYEDQVEACEKNKKMWDESKKVWQMRSRLFLGTLEKLIAKLKLPGSSIKSEGIKLSTSKRTCLEVDEDWLLDQYQTYIDALKLQLPDYIKVTMSVDKNKLFAHVKTDNQMLINNPDIIHTKETFSTSIK